MTTQFTLKGMAFGALVTAAALFAAPAHAGLLTFSGDASDDDAPIDVFDGRIEWSFAGTTLTVTLYNDTVAPNAYTLSIFSFNVSDAVTSVVELDDGALNATIGAHPGSQGGFGPWDYRVDLGTGNNGVAAGGSATLTFTVGGVGLDESDFFVGDPAGLIHFTRGPGDDSAWVIPGDDPVVPEPATIALLGAGVAMLAVRRRFV